mmetsp:Transcript_40829/g.131756  ORF Transcript_40829/g.131756 Transcript_40829/m.131756 type:complete len:195 (+) Transcript_40829:2076-2660(+)
MQLSADVRTGAEVGAAVSLHNITKREASYGDENVNVVLAQAGYSSSSALESPCAPHRVLNHYLTHKMDVVRGLVSLLMPPAFLAARDSALALDSKDEKSSEYQLKQHYMLLDFLFTHVLVLCHARPLNNDALIDADAKPLIDTFALLRSLLSSTTPISFRLGSRSPARRSSTCDSGRTLSLRTRRSYSSPRRTA